MESQTSFAELPEEQQAIQMGDSSEAYVNWMLDYICQHRDPVCLLLTRSDGTSYQHFIEHMVDVEVEYTLQYIEVLRHLGKDVPQLSESLCRIIASAMFNGLFEIAIQDMPKQQRLQYIDQFRMFYSGGWLTLMGQ